MRPSRDQILLDIAAIFATRGTCLRTQVGAVIAVDGHIVSTGYNGAPTGTPHCNPEICTPENPCTRTIHAEANAIAFAARRGQALEGSTLYCTHSPCLDCAKLIINSGIKHVVYEEEYRKKEGIEILHSVGITAGRLQR